MPATIALTTLAMLAFAANSLLARQALATGGIDAASFTMIRLGSGAVALAALLAWQRGRRPASRAPGTWISSLCLLAYAAVFSFAYLRLGAATGALILFTAVQATMIGWALARGTRPTTAETLGLAIAFCAFVYLLLPGLQTPDLAGSAMMIGSGIAWGAYSLRGRGVRDPLAETAGNFSRAALIGLPLAALPLVAHHANAAGVTLAAISGVVTSGLGYALWYRALPRLSTALAATVQLTVPVLASIGAVAVLAEPMNGRLAIAGACILGGVALSIAGRRPSPR